MSSPGGWRDRVKKANERQVARDNAAEIRAERARHAAEKEARDRQDAAAEIERNRAVLVSCPCCDGGHVTAEFAERVYRALERLPSDSRPELAVIEHLVAVARGQAPAGTSRAPRMTVGVRHPQPVPQATEARKRSHSKGLETAAGLTEDGALIELD